MNLNQGDPADSPLTIGLDIGTTSIKGAAFTLDGQAIASASVPTTTHEPRPGRAFYRPDEIWDAAVQVIRGIVAQIERPERIAGIATASMGEAGVLLGAGGEPVADIIAWFDRRTIPQTEWLVATLGEARLTGITGLSPQPIYSVNKLLWHREHEPDAYGRARRWMHMADFIAFRLCGVPATDWSLASRTSAFDLRALRWSEEILDATGIAPTLLAPAVQSGARIGSVRSDAAELTGLPAGVAVATGGHDHVCGALAAGATTPGAILDSLGTAEALMMCTDRPVDDPWYMRAGYTQGAHVAPGMYYINGSVRSSGSSVNWLRNLIGPETPVTALIEDAASVPPGAHGAMFLPHLWLGDAPHPDTLSRGALVGLSGGLGRGAIVRAVLEGLAFEARSGFDPLLTLSDRTAYPEITAIGGGSRNELLLRIKASVMNATLRSIDVQEATSLGAAMLAAIGAGLFVDVADALRHVRHQSRLIEPVPEWVATYDRLNTGVFCDLYTSLKDLHHSLTDGDTQA